MDLPEVRRVPASAAAVQFAGMKKASHFRGVYQHGKRWKAKIYSRGVAYNLGVFVTEVEAAFAYDSAARKLHSEHAVTNFSPEGTETQSITLRRALVDQCRRDGAKDCSSSGSEPSLPSNSSSATGTGGTSLAMQHHVGASNCACSCRTVSAQHAHPEASRTVVFMAGIPQNSLLSQGQSVGGAVSVDSGAVRQPQKRLWRDCSTGLLTGDITKLREYIEQLQQQLQMLMKITVDGATATEEIKDEYVALSIRLDDATNYLNEITPMRVEQPTISMIARHY